MTPSAPRSNALRTKRGSIRPVQGRRMMRTLLAMCSRLVPARSAPVYVHQLQTKAVMRGSKSPSAVTPARISLVPLTSVPCRQRVDLGVDLLVGERLELDALAQADRLAGAAALADARVDARDRALQGAVAAADLL